MTGRYFANPKFAALIISGVLGDLHQVGRSHLYFHCVCVCVCVCVSVCPYWIIYLPPLSCSLPVDHWFTWKVWVFVIISVRPASQLSVCGKTKVNFFFFFLEHYKYGKYQTLHNGSAHWALPILTSFSDLDCISRSHQRQTVLTEIFTFFSY